MDLVKNIWSNYVFSYVTLLIYLKLNIKYKHNIIWFILFKMKYENFRNLGLKFKVPIALESSSIIQMLKLFRQFKSRTFLSTGHNLFKKYTIRNHYNMFMYIRK